jgi:hypothetical protein
MRGDDLVFTVCFFFSSIPIPRFCRRSSRSWSVESRRAEVSVSGTRSGVISKERSAFDVNARFISSLAIWSAGEIVRAWRLAFN